MHCKIDYPMNPYLRLIRFDKPVGTLLLLWPTLWALWLATDFHPPMGSIIIFTLGSFLMRSAGCVINDIADRNIDGLVARTRTRPLANKEISLTNAVIFFLFLLACSASLLLFLPYLCWLLAFIGALIAVSYPFCKRFFIAPQAVLSFAFAWGIPMAYAASLAHIPRTAWWLLGIVALWIFAYDTTYALTDREDDQKIGVHSTALWLGEHAKTMIGFLQVGVVFGLALLGYGYQLHITYYLALLFSAGIFCYQQNLIGHGHYQRAFLSNQWCGALIFLGIACERFFI
jgi:4-hydroxybenzoate polyprenyltransferase